MVLKLIFIISISLFLFSPLIAQREFRVIEAENFDTVSIIQQPNTVYVLYTFYTCKDCYKDIENIVTMINERNKKQFPIVAILRAGSGIISQKTHLKTLKSVLKANAYYFDIVEEDDPNPPINLKGGVFGNYPIKQTPIIVFHNGKKEIVVPYMDMFAKGVDLYSVLKGIFVDKKE